MGNWYESIDEEGRGGVTGDWRGMVGKEEHERRCDEMRAIYHRSRKDTFVLKYLEATSRVRRLK